MTGIEAGKTWSRVGPEVAPTSSSASGVFTLSEYSENQGAGTWPNPAVGWMAYFKPSVYGSSWLYTQLMLDDSDNIHIATIGTVSGVTQTGIVKLNSDGAAVAANHTTGSPSSFYSETKGLIHDATNNKVFLTGKWYQSGDYAATVSFPENLSSITPLGKTNNPATAGAGFQNDNTTRATVLASNNRIWNIARAHDGNRYKGFLWQNGTDGTYYSTGARDFNYLSSSNHMWPMSVWTDNTYGYALIWGYSTGHMFYGDSSGSIWKQQRSTNSYPIVPDDIVEKSSTEVVISGAYANGNTDNRCFVQVFNKTSFAVSWTQDIVIDPNQGHTNGMYTSVCVDSSENVYIGWREQLSQGSGNWTYCYAKYNTSGTLQYSRSIECTTAGNTSAFAAWTGNTPHIKISSDGSTLIIQGGQLNGGTNPLAGWVCSVPSDGGGVGGTVTINSQTFEIKNPTMTTRTGQMDGWQNGQNSQNSGTNSGANTALSGAPGVSTYTETITKGNI